MGRPNVINEPRRTYNLLISIRDFESLRGISLKRSRAEGVHVSIAHLLRDGAKAVIEYHRQEEKGDKA